MLESRQHFGNRSRTRILPGERLQRRNREKQSLSHSTNPLVH